MKRLERLLTATRRVEISGSSTDPAQALEMILESKPDVLFLDIEMPGMNGFEMLSQLDPQPLVVFTTAFDRYALQAFGVNSIDYLLKPVEAAHLGRALDKIERIRGGSAPRPQIQELLAAIAKHSEYPQRIASRTGDRLEFVELARVTHFFASDKLTYAATGARNHVVDQTIQDLEQKLDPHKFVRIHRSILVNLNFVQELHSWFGGKMMVRLKDEKRTELTVSRDRVRELKQRLGV